LKGFFPEKKPGKLNKIFPPFSPIPPHRLMPGIYFYGIFDFIRKHVEHLTPVEASFTTPDSPLRAATGMKQAECNPAFTGERARTSDRW
jgi:hypothetical protein